MAGRNEGKHTADFILSEASAQRSRERVVLSSAAGVLVPGTVLGKVTASGEYVAYANDASDGSEVAAGILYAHAPDAASDQAAAIIGRTAEVVQAELTGIDADAIADLRAIGIVCRT